jgi:hypothetical protein
MLSNFRNVGTQMLFSLNLGTFFCTPSRTCCGHNDEKEIPTIFAAICLLGDVKHKESVFSRSPQCIISGDFLILLWNSIYSNALSIGFGKAIPNVWIFQWDSIFSLHLWLYHPHPMLHYPLMWFHHLQKLLLPQIQLFPPLDYAATHLPDSTKAYWSTSMLLQICHGVEPLH